MRRLARWPKNPPAGRGALILLYHRVAEPRSDPWSLAVAPRHFAEHLQILRQHARPIGLRRLSRGLIDGDLPDRSVVVTFDDGYADNLHNAKPLLERYDVPATVFLTTGYIGHEREFWWDELDRILLQPGTLPEALRLSVNGRTHRWKLGKAARYREENARRRRWGAWRGTFGARHRLYHSLWELLHPLPEGERRKALDELLAWAGAEPAVRPNHRPVSLEEAVALTRGGLIEAGAHTVTHPALSALPAALQRDEIRGSKAFLEEVLGRRVDSFAYPHGSLSAETVGIVREAGFACACAGFGEVVGRSADRFRLPRVQVADRGAEWFAGWLSGRLPRG